MAAPRSSTRDQARAVALANRSRCLVLTGATSNDWYFIAVRPISHRSSPMIRPDGRVTFVSPDLDPVPAGPYIETLSAITVPPGARYDAPNVSGPETLI